MLDWREQKLTERLWARRRYNGGVLTLYHPSRTYHGTGRPPSVERNYPDEVIAYIRRGSMKLRWG